MKLDLIETARLDLAENLTTNRVLHLTATDDPHWRGVVTLAPSNLYAVPPRSRHDVYVLRGSVEAGSDLLDQGEFVSLCEAGVLRAGSEGVRLFIYRETAPVHCETITQHANDREWYAGQNPRMRVAPLSSRGHRLTLVAWEPDTHTRDHGHQNGEEILVLSGELRSHDQRYPAGTWIRLHPGARDEPFTEIPTVIMLRNGHLEGARITGA
ncbi:cupin domain-containing protein [Paraburkholderia sp. RL18-085-BIA-A]|uniref:cupin domain-containing protein n=1 Tax=Paraburkholderia sp. RL18-085-BIA-A TaxID=3031633 RepID=UPI0038B8B94A